MARGVADRTSAATAPYAAARAAPVARYTARGTVPAIFLVVDHDLALNLLLAELGQIVEILHGHYVGRDAAGRSSDAHPQAEHVQRLIERRQHPRRFRAAFPVRNLRRMMRTLLNPAAFICSADHCNRPVERGRSAEPRSDAVTEVGQAVVALAVCQRGGNKLVGRCLILLREVLCVPGLRHGRAQKGRQCGRARDRHKEHYRTKGIYAETDFL